LLRFIILYLGNKYLDFISAYSAVNQGHLHPRIMKTFIEQTQKLTLTSRAVHNNLLGLACKKMHDIFGYEKTLFMNTGV
jgi:ornithine--oxo-acid transaminase